MCNRLTESLPGVLTYTAASTCWSPHTAILTVELPVTPSAASAAAVVGGKRRIGYYRGGVSAHVALGGQSNGHEEHQ